MTRFRSLIPFMATMAAFAIAAPAVGAAETPAPVAPVAAPTAKLATAAKIVVPISARTKAGGGAVKMRLKPTAPINGGAHQLLVTGSTTVGKTEWLRVLLPMRPNGATGWVRRDDVALVKITHRVVVDISSRTATVYKFGRQIKRIRVVVGAPRTPTPLGQFAISEHLRQSGSGSFVGSSITLITGFSNVHYSFDGGPGRVAMHGRGGASMRDPLGSAKSNGCIRMNNSDANWIASKLPIGTPLLIRR